MFVDSPLQRALAATSVVALCFVVSACDDSAGIGPNLFSDVVKFTENISVSDLGSMIDTGTVRIEIRLGPDDLVAHRVEVQESESPDEPEAIQSRIVDISVTDQRSILVLQLGDLEVGFNSETQFRTSGGHDMAFEQFVGHVREALAANEPLGVRAKRRPPDVPQDPNDAEFLADELRIQGLVEEHEIEITIDADNLHLNASPPPDLWITVLALEIEVRASEGLTELEHERPYLVHADFEGLVQAVDLDLRELTLADETVIRLVDGTEIKQLDHDRRLLPDLSAVAEALEAGHVLFAAGEGVIQSEAPLTIVASRIVFELELSIEGFEGVVQSVNHDSRTVTLVNGIVVRIDDETNLRSGEDDRHVLGSLEAVQEALDGNRRVYAFGEGLVETEEPLTILAVHAVFKLALEDFEHVVASVNLEARTATLDNGWLVRIDDETHIRHGETDSQTLGSLEEVAQAIDAGKRIFAFGEGLVEAEEPVTILAFHIVFEVKLRVEEFEATVESVNAQEGIFTLFGGTLVTVTDETKIDADGHLHSLAEVADTLSSGEVVIAIGVGVYTSEGDAVALTATRLKFLIRS